MSRIALAAVVAVSLSACGDGARDAGFRGRPLGRISGLQLADSHLDGLLVERGTDERIGGAILWSVVGAEALLDERNVFALRLEGGFDLEVYAPPPERALRPAARGRIALGQVVFYRDRTGARADHGVANAFWLGRSELLVAWTPEGAAGGIVLGELAPGLNIVRPSAPCDVTPLFTFAVRPHDPLEVRLVPGLPATALFSDPGCAAALDDDPIDCPSLGGTRWWCRDGPATDELCARCEPLLFPAGASRADCDAWYDDCRAQQDPPMREPECWSEWRVCIEGARP